MRDSVIFEDVLIKKDAAVYTAIVDSEALIESGVTVGEDGADKNSITVIASGSVVEKNVRAGA